jgi:hypothetical protein
MREEAGCNDLRAEESGWEQGCYVMERVLVQNREITSRTNEHRSACSDRWPIMILTSPLLCSSNCDISLPPIGLDGGFSSLVY